MSSILLVAVNTAALVVFLRAICLVSDAQPPWHASAAWLAGMLAEYGKDALVDARDTTSRRAAWLQFVGGSSVVAYVSTYSSHYTLASLRALALTACYARPLPGTSVCVKTAFPLSKPLFVAMLHCIWAHDVMRGVLSAYATAWLFVFEFMASSILDFKDEEEDARAGVRTLVVCAGAEGARRTLLVLCGLGLVLAPAAPSAAAARAVVATFVASASCLRPGGSAVSRAQFGARMSLGWCAAAALAGIA